MTEVWKPVPEFEEFYEISNFGNVRSLDRIVTQKTRSGTNCVHSYKGRPLKLDLTYGQYYTFAAYGKTRIKKIRVHRAVAQVFIENPFNYPIVNHIDGDKLNNHYSNLEWCTHQGNMDHAVKTGLIKSGLTHPCIAHKIQIFYNKVLIKECFGIKELQEMGFTHTSVNRYIKGERTPPLNYSFKKIKL